MRQCRLTQNKTQWRKHRSNSYHQEKKKVWHQPRLKEKVKVEQIKIAYSVKQILYEMVFATTTKVWPEY